MTMPNFLIIGAAKAGTTALYNYLNEHPQVFMSPIKESNFFAYDAKSCDPHYLGHRPENQFPIQTLTDYERLFENASGASAIGEASPIYLESPIAAANIQHHLPEVRLIASLRNPVERAISGWMMHVRKGKESGKLIDRVDPETHYVKVGYYYPKLRRYYDLIPSQRLKVFLFDDFQGDTLAVMQGLFRFLEVNDTFLPNVQVVHNPGTFPRHRRMNAILANRTLHRIVKPLSPSWLTALVRDLYRKNLGPPPEISWDLRQQLRELYREDILQLQDLIQMDLSCWLTD